MIRADQPKIFKGLLGVGISSVDDGNMGRTEGLNRQQKANRQRFLEALDIPIESTSLVNIDFDDATDYCRYQIIHQAIGGVTSPTDVITDALVVTRPGLGLFLPLGDCCGAVIFDPHKQILMLSHLGRHSVENQGAQRSIEFLADQLGAKPEQLLVWLSPAVGAETYPLFNFSGASLHQVIFDQLLANGILQNNIEVSPVDTAFDHNYFSHSQFLAGNIDRDGRHAVAVMIKEKPKH